MIKELRKLDKTNHTKANRVRNLQARGCISKILNEKGYCCYDTEELKKYEATSKIGRPVKINK